MSGERENKLTTFVLLVLIMLLGVVLVRTAWVCDDAYITFRTVDNFTNGYGLRWNTSERVQVYTHPLWALLLCLVGFFTHELYLSSILLSITLSLSAVFLLSFRIGWNRTLSILGIVVLLRSKAFIDYSTSGLENPLTYFLLAVFFALYFEAGEYAPRKLFLLSVVASMGTLNRMDTILLFAPALVYAALKARSPKAFLALAVGFLPFILWECFSIFYYGFPFPNPAYAKLGTGIDTMELMRQGLRYFLHSVRFDPVTMLAIGCGIIIPLQGRGRDNIPIAAGITLYLLYILKIGGDFMGGRFFAAPLICAVTVISRATIIWEDKRAYITALACALLLGLLAAEPLQLIGKDGIMDERICYYNDTGLFRSNRGESLAPAHEWINEGRRLRESAPAVAETGYVGMCGFYAGPQVHLIDYFGLTDPLMARLPAKYSVRWRIGHFQRFVPSGYVDTISTGENKLTDPDLMTYYDKLVIVISGPLLSRERWMTILRMNAGKYDELINLTKYRYPDLERRTITEVNPPEKPIEVGAGGLEITIGKNATARIAEICVENPVSLRAYFLAGDRVLGCRNIAAGKDETTANIVYRIKVPARAVAKGYSGVRLFPLSSKPPCSLVRFGLTDEISDLPNT